MARFTRRVPAPKVTGGYGAFKPFVREDFEQCCAYCYLHEFHARGKNNFELDHFQPKEKFPERRNDFYNIYYSCHVCNSIHGKWSHWPTDQQIAEGVGFVDFCKDDFKDHYEILPDGKLKPLTKSAEYTIDTIRLNSDYLVEYRADLLRRNESLDKKPKAVALLPETNSED